MPSITLYNVMPYIMLYNVMPYNTLYVMPYIITYNVMLYIIRLCRIIIKILSLYKYATRSAVIMKILSLYKYVTGSVLNIKMLSLYKYAMTVFLVRYKRTNEPLQLQCSRMMGFTLIKGGKTTERD